MSITVNEAGKIGGLKTLTTRGNAFFVEIGSKGQKALRINHPGMASFWGKLGGRPRKANLKENPWEQGNKK